MMVTTSVHSRYFLASALGLAAIGFSGIGLAADSTADSVPATAPEEAVLAKPATQVHLAAIRVGALLGVYEFNPDSDPARSGDTYGLQIAGRYTNRGLLEDRDLFVEAALERTSNRDPAVDDFNRTDLLLSLGVRATSRLTPFVGYRFGWQDTSLGSAGLFDSGWFSDRNFYSESGALAGLNIIVWEGERLLGSLTFAYNRTDVRYGKSLRELFPDDDRQQILSATLGLGLKGSDTQVLLRAQRFSLDRDRDNRAAVEDVGGDGADYEETYVHLILQHRWAFFL